MTIGTEDDNRAVVAALAKLMGAGTMTTPMFERVALIGIGLIGSSLSHAMRRGGLARTIVGHAQSEKTRETALRLGLVSSAYASAEEAVRGADLVILCAPVGACGAIAKDMGPSLRARRHRDRRRVGEGRHRARRRPVRAEGRAFHSGPPDRRHRAFRARGRLRRAVRRPLVRADAAARRRSGGRRQAAGVLAGVAARTSR